MSNDKPREFWISKPYHYEEIYTDLWVSSISPDQLTDDQDYMDIKGRDMYHVIEYSAYENLKDDYGRLQYKNADLVDLLAEVRADLDVAIEALKKINETELNSQRPGGGYSTSARISYETLARLTKEQK